MTKKEIKLHKAAELLLSKETLTHDEKIDVYDNWYPSYNSQVKNNGAFFTPYLLARDFCLHVHGKRIIDLCAGIGVLSFIYYHRMRLFEETECEIVCVEQNWEYIQVGKKLFPEATWVHGNACDEEFIKSLGKFDFAISNPPFGNVRTHSLTDWTGYTGKEFEYIIIAAARQLADEAAFIVPQMSAPFRYSGQPYMREGITTNKYDKFNRQTGIELQPNIGVDTSIYTDEWKGTNIITEIVCVEYPPIVAEEEEEEPALSQLVLF